MHQRECAARTASADRMSRICRALHARESAGRAHGFVRRSLRGLLPLPAACGCGMRKAMSGSAKRIAELSCPIPFAAKDTIVLGHGSGGKLSAELLRQIFLPAFQNPTLGRLDDQAVVSINGSRLAFTTDSFVVRPLFFPGGDIGSLAVYVTVNDLAVGGALPLFLSVAFILEEGLPIETLQRVVQSARRAAEQAGVQIVTGDTKVVEKGNCDG